MSEIIPSQLAKILNLKRQAIYMAIKRGNLILNSGGMIDTQNTKNQSWLNSHGQSELSIQSAMTTIQEKTESNRKLKPLSNPLPEIREKSKEKHITIQQEQIKALEEYLNNNQSENKNMDAVQFEDVSGLPAKMMSLNLYELVKRYGGPMGLESYAKILKIIIGATLQDQKIQTERLKLIEKDFIISKIFLYLEILSNRLFDYCETFPTDIISMVESEPKSAEIESKKKMRKDISLLIKESKESIINELENLKNKYSKKDDSTD